MNEYSVREPKLSTEHRFQRNYNGEIYAIRPDNKGFNISYLKPEVRQHIEKEVTKAEKRRSDYGP